MIEAWMVWVIGTCMFAAGLGVGFWQGLVKGQQQAKAWLDYTLACQTNANVTLEHTNKAQELKDKRTAAWYASKREQGSQPRQNRRDVNRANEMVNGHDEGH